MSKLSKLNANKSKRSGARSKSDGDTVTITGLRWQSTNTVVTAAAQTVVAVDPTHICDERGLEMADLYRYYRFDHIRIHHTPAEAARVGIMGFCIGGTITPPTLASEVLAMQRASFGFNSSNSVAWTVFALTAKDLSGNVKWWMTENTGDPEVETQANLVASTVSYSSGIAVQAALEIIYDYRITFHGRLTAAETLARIAKRKGFVPSELRAISPDEEKEYLDVTSSPLPQPISITAELSQLRKQLSVTSPSSTATSLRGKLK